MKNAFVILITSLVLSTAFGASKAVECVGPVGGKLSSLQGTLNLAPNSNGQKLVTGLVKVNYGNEIAVEGVYDDVRGFEYATLGTSKDSKIDIIYINFNDSSDKASSYIEMSGKQFPLNCEGSKK